MIGIWPYVLYVTLAALTMLGFITSWFITRSGNPKLGNSISLFAWGVLLGNVVWITAVLESL